MSDFAKRVNDRSLADINRANAAFHSPVSDSEDAEKGKAKPLPGFKPVSKGAERTASERANVMAGKDPKAADKGLHELGGGQTEHSMSAAEFNEHTKGVKVTRNAGGHEVVRPQPYKTGSNTPNWRAPKGSAFHVDGDVSDISHEGGKQIVKKKGQVVAQHDKDSFPATDKTIKDVNDANQQYYNNSPHAGMAQDSNDYVSGKMATEHQQAIEKQKKIPGSYESGAKSAPLGQASRGAQSQASKMAARQLAQQRAGHLGHSK